MQISRIFWILVITNWWHQPEEMHRKYSDLSIVRCDMLSIIPHSVGVEPSFSLGRDVINWRLSITTGETLPEKEVVRHFAPGKHRILADDDPSLDIMNTENKMEIKIEVEKMKLARNGQGP
jgi:hypothetical protein